MPIEKLDNGQCVIFDFSRGATCAAITYSKFSPECTVDEAAKEIINRKMVELSFVFNGVGADKTTAILGWEKWLKDLGLVARTNPSRPQKLFNEALEKYVDAISTIWRKEGVFTEGQEFNNPSTPSKRGRRKKLQGIKFSEWAIVQSMAPDWNGQFDVSVFSLTIKYLSLTAIVFERQC